MENKGASTVCPLDPGSPLFFPHAAFHFPPKDKKEAYDFIDKVVDKHRRLCDERQCLGLKRQTLEACIARVERKVRAMENDPFQWEWRNFDCVARIPTMLRMYLCARDQVLGPVNALVEGKLDGVSVSANNFDLKWDCDLEGVGVMDEDIPNVPDRKPSPPRDFFRSQIRAPCALIKELSKRDQEIAMAFIKDLVVQHQKRSLEKKKLQKKINQMLRRVTAISRELHTLNTILDLASQGV
ncbi:unnamed protein product [Arabidopsis thaliana]|uniref:Uncharacterized protein n=1 Tax=Arabidopsis thaliana TaxID=3702 RepID=A0A5S9Y841_ARATH|nr:unnamed protein product [Arabidopsis thaliana]